MQIRPATSKRFAVINLTREDEEAIAKIEPESFLPESFLEVRFPEGLRLNVSQGETLTEEGPAKLQGDILVE